MVGQKFITLAAFWISVTDAARAVGYLSDDGGNDGPRGLTRAVGIERPQNAHRLAERSIKAQSKLIRRDFWRRVWRLPL